MCERRGVSRHFVLVLVNRVEERCLSKESPIILQLHCRRVRQFRIEFDASWKGRLAQHWGGVYGALLPPRCVGRLLLFLLHKVKHENKDFAIRLVPGCIHFIARNWEHRQVSTHTAWCQNELPFRGKRYFYNKLHFFQPRLADVIFERNEFGVQPPAVIPTLCVDICRKNGWLKMRSTSITMWL